MQTVKAHSAADAQTCTVASSFVHIQLLQLRSQSHVPLHAAMHVFEFVSKSENKLCTTWHRLGSWSAFRTTFLFWKPPGSHVSVGRAEFGDALISAARAAMTGARSPMPSMVAGVSSRWNVLRRWSCPAYARHSMPPARHGVVLRCVRLCWQHGLACRPPGRPSGLWLRARTPFSRAQSRFGQKRFGQSRFGQSRP